jgi:HSP20 family molecular chaperone IbpA
MDQLFFQLLGGSGAVGVLLSGPEIQWIPALEIEDRNLVVQTDLPGMSADDVTVEADAGLLTISEERREQREVGGDGERRTERQYGRFSRSLVPLRRLRRPQARASGPGRFSGETRPRNEDSLTM